MLIKKFSFNLTISILLFVFTPVAFSQSVAINNNGAIANQSSILDVNSNTKGILIPRLSKVQKNSIFNPAIGLLVYQTEPDSVGFHYFDGVRWLYISTINYLDTVAWKVNGNNGTNANNNFLGTKDNVPLNFKQNNKWIGRLDASKSNYLIGDSAGANLKSTGNVAIGTASLKRHNGVGEGNTAIGDSTLTNATSNQNTAIGFNVLTNSTTGGLNTGLGYKSLKNNIIGNANIAIGSLASFNNLSGYENIAIGQASMYSNQSSNLNVSIGSNSLFYNTIGNENIAIGSNSMFSHKYGNSNTAVGTSSLMADTSGYNNTAIGYESLASNNTGFSNTAIGLSALGQSSIGNLNTALGVYSLGSNNAGNSNNAIGYASLPLSENGNHNIAIGNFSGVDNINGSNNIFIGDSSNVTSGNFVNSIVIGNKAVISQSNSMLLGNSNITKWGFGINVSSNSIIEFVNTPASLTIGGVWTNASNSNLKENFIPLNSKLILEGIVKLPITRWNYKNQSSSITHIGPTAQDFYSIFKTGENNRTISTIDPAGVALIGVKELSKQVEELKKEIEYLKSIIKNK